MSIKMFWNAQGMLLGDVLEVNEDHLVVEQPVYVIMGPNGASLVPILGLSDDTKVKIKHSELLFNASLVDPISELRNHYSSTFGSGIQLLSK